MAPTSADYINTNGEKSNAIIFDTTKDELFRLSDNYKTLQRKLKGILMSIYVSLNFCSYGSGS